MRIGGPVTSPVMSSPPASPGSAIKSVFNGVHSQASRWFKHISDAAEAYKTREGKHRRQDTASHDDSLSHDKTKDSEESGASGSELLSPHRANGSEEAQSPSSDNTTPHASPSPQLVPTPTSETPDSTFRKLGEGLGSPSPGAIRRAAEPLRQTTAESCLIEPSEVVICQSPVLTAEPVLTPLEQLRRADEAIERALGEKQRLVAEILHVPRADYDAIADLAAEPAADPKEPAEILLAAVNQANKLWSAVNEALRVTEEEAVSASADPARARMPGVPARHLHQISSTLNSQLSLLLNIMTARDEERERLRQEVQRSREQLHSLYERKESASPHDPGLEAHEEPAPGTTTAPALALDVVSDPAAPAHMPTTPEVYVDALTGETDSAAPEPEAAPAAATDAE